MGLLTKEAILASDDRKTVDLEVGEWGGTVRVGVMSATERDRWESTTYGGEKPDMTDFRARFVALCLVDKDGKRLFSDKEVGQLGTKSAAALERVFKVAQKLNAVTDEAVQDLGKDSAAGQSGASNSASPGA